MPKRRHRHGTAFAFALLLAVGLAVGGDAHAADSAKGRASATPLEDYMHEAMPPGFQVINNELEGPLFADASGHPLYIWPFRPMRKGEAGDHAGKSACDNHKVTVNGGFMEPYPGGLILPDIDHRPSCAEMWPPVHADAAAKPVGKWSIIVRDDGTKQWAYNRQALYTSILDRAPGDVIGSTRHGRRVGGGRVPVGPPPNVPAGFQVIQTRLGRMLTNEGGRSVYTRDADLPNKSMCNAACAQYWKPVDAPALAESRGEFSVFERAPGIKQWAFRKKPLYTYDLDPEGRSASVIGGDEPGWHNVYTQHVLPPPKEFTFQDSPTGILLADHRGMTVYAYNCTDDAQDQLICDYPEAPQEYRLAVCGGGDVDKCLKTFPYVPGDKDAKSESRLWTVMAIDPKTGHRGTAGQPGIMTVWAYRDRPVYTFVGDREPGDRFGAGWGEGEGSKNGFTAITVRDDFFGRD